jgi:hypothetical protein
MLSSFTIAGLCAGLYADARVAAKVEFCMIDTQNQPRYTYSYSAGYTTEVFLQALREGFSPRQAQTMREQNRCGSLWRARSVLTA